MIGPLLDRLGRPYTCDWWMPDRAKHDAPATHEGRDAHGAPWRYCARHWAIAHPGIQFIHGPLTQVTP